MRKVLATVLLPFFVCLCVFSAVEYPSSVSSVQKSRLDGLFQHAVSGRNDCDIRVTGFSEEDGVIRLSFILGDGDYSISAPDWDRLGRFLDNALFLEESLFLPGDHVEYVNGTVVSASGDFSSGNLYYAVDAGGRKKALLSFDRINENGEALLRPLWVSSLIPGYGLVKGPSWAFDIGGTSTLRNSCFSILATIRQISWSRYFRPLVSFGFYRTKEGDRYMVGAGIEARAPLAGLFSTDFPMIEDAAIYASAYLLSGIGSSFVWGAGYSFGYEQILFGRMYYRIGYAGASFTDPALNVSLGVMF